jgi:TolB-like protein
VAAVSAAPLSIIVLPFANQTGDPQKAYVADALTSSITADLARIRDAYVSSPATAQSYRDKNLSAQQIGRDAGVRFILQGNVLTSGDKVRISVTLTDTHSGAALWAYTLDGDLTNLFALQDQVTNQIGNSIGRQMVIVAASEAEKRSSSPKVADLLLRAAALRLKVQTLAVLQQSEALNRQVLALEPDNINALTDLAISLFRQAYNFGNQTPDDVREKQWTEVRDIGARVRALDPNNADILYALGFYASRHDDFAAWRSTAEAYLAARPKSLLPYIGLANLHIALAEPNDAISRLKQAITLDPKHPPETIFTNMARAHMELGDNDAARDWCLKGTQAYPAYPNCYAILAMVYAGKGDAPRKQAALDELKRVAPLYRIPEFAKPQPSSPAAYKTYYEEKYLPMWRKAGLAE